MTIWDLFRKNPKPSGYEFTLAEAHRRLLALEVKMSAVDDAVTNLKTKIENLEARVTAHEQNDANTIATLNGTIASLNANIAALQTAASNQSAADQAAAAAALQKNVDDLNTLASGLDAFDPAPATPAPTPAPTTDATQPA